MSRIHMRGFASMSPEKRLAAASRGGKSTAQKLDMREIGRKGGRKTALRGSSYYSEIGRRGGRGGTK